MIDYFNIPIPTHTPGLTYSTTIDTQIFNCLGSTAWQTWHKPRGKSMALINCIGSGAGGGGGFTGGTGTSRTGGGGGGSGGVTSLLIAISLLPDILYSNVAEGGAGAAAAGTGTSGALSYLSVRPDTTVQNLLLRSSNAGAVGGAAGGVGAGGTGGAAATVTTQLLCGPLSSNGQLTFSAGHIGSAGGLTGIGTDFIWGAGSLTITGGAGGGGTNAANANAAGGSITTPDPTGAAGPFVTLLGGLSGVNTSSAGLAGPVYWTPFMASGGSGGGSSGAGTGGIGGNGNIGSGGGGGGGGITGGAGGRGGHGIVIITSW